MRLTCLVPMCLLLMTTALGQKQYYEIQIGGKDAGMLKRYVNETVTPIPGLGQPPKPGSITITSGQGMLPSFYTWLGAGLSGDGGGTACRILTIDSHYNEVGDLQLASVTIQEVRLPALDSSSNEFGGVTVKFLPTPIQVKYPTQPVHHFPGGGGVSWRRSSYELKIDGVDCSKVSRIEPLRLRPGRQGKLTVTLPRDAASGFDGWKPGQRYGGSLRIGDGLLELRFRNLHVDNTTQADRTKVELTWSRVEISAGS